ncbi:MAG TPA: methyltransferase domain-containing protein [Burkholderiaceae bacterium]|nr:methyltransferase domain-containing protein [Burkholderiaceae bacterium]
MVAILGFTRERVIAAVKDMYTDVANAPARPYHFPVGRDAARAVGYSDELLAAVPEEALASFAGVGCPFRAGAIRPGDTVLDIGSGAGTDALIAARLVGPRGKVHALDMTPAMVRKLRSIAAALPAPNLEVVEANAEAIPLPDASVDVVTSNGMLNLVPDKRRAIAEIFRVLKPGGRVQIADIVIRRPVTLDCKSDPKLWAECVVGATVDEDYLAFFRDAGFEDVDVLHDAEYFELSRSAETREVARRFGARSVEIAMRRAPAAPPRWVQLARRADPRRAVRSLRRRGLAGAAALVLSLLACYGTLAAIAALSLAGISVVIDPGAWSAVILVFGLAAVVAIGAGMRKHGRIASLLVALAGGALLAYAHLVEFTFMLELGGFVLLGAAVFLDLHARRAVPADRLLGRRHPHTA